MKKYIYFLLIFNLIFVLNVFSQISIINNDSVKIGAEEGPAKFTIGGAVRLNYSWQDYNQERKDIDGDFGFELFRLDIDAEFKEVYLSVQYRWYEQFEAIHHGFFGYHINPDLDIELGIHQVPFGILPYASHSFWFGGTYYLGFEDDYDSGIKLNYRKNRWNFHAAFYKNSEFVDASRLGRYSFDLVTGGEQTNKEINQFNLRIAHDILSSENVILNLGASLEVGSIYNQTTRKKGGRHAFALHSDLKFSGWNIQLQGIDYKFNPVNPPGVDEETIQFGAFMYPFLVAADGQVLSFNVAKNFKFKKHLIDEISFYNDFTFIKPSGTNVKNSIQNVTGCLIVIKKLYIYTDWVFGKNMWFSGGSGIGLNEAGANEWHGRININFGYYFSSNTCR